MSKNSKHKSAESRTDAYCVMQARAKGWVVKKGRSPQPSRTYKTQAEAENVAKEMVRISGGTVRVQGRDGRWRESFTLGRDGFARISAIEKVQLTREMRRDFGIFDRKALSAEQRRTLIASKYGRKPA